SSRATGDSSSDADEPRAHLLPRRADHEGARQRAGRDREVARRCPARDHPRADRRVQARRVGGHRGAQDARVLRAADARGQPRVGSALREDARGGLSPEVPAVTRLVIGVTGASGSIYGIRLLEVLRGSADVQTHLVISAAGKRTIVEETSYSVADLDDIVNHTVARVLDRLDLPQTLVAEWQGAAQRAARDRLDAPRERLDD